MRIRHSNFIRIGNYMYSSNGDFGPTPRTAEDITTGEIAWRQRTFGKANALTLGEKGPRPQRRRHAGRHYTLSARTASALEMQGAKQQSVDSTNCCRIQALCQKAEGNRCVWPEI